MAIRETLALEGNLLATLLAEEGFWPTEPGNLSDAGLPGTFVESMVAKCLLVYGTSSGRTLAERICLPFGSVQDVINALRTRQLIVHSGSAAFNDYYYSLTEHGSRFAQNEMKQCAYVGPAPITLDDYIVAVEAQSITAEQPKRETLQRAFDGIVVDAGLLETLGPAINSGSGLFLYGAPGNGKSTLAKRITMCFGQHIWIPHAIIDSGQIIKVFDPAYHQPANAKNNGMLKSHDFDRRWIRVKRPTVVVGGELTLDALEIRHDRIGNTSEAPLQMKSNCGCLLIDDFGRQRAAPSELLNRWIIPLESRVDYLTLPTGKKIQVPFDQLTIFSTNLDPNNLVDEAFLRRIPYKIEVKDPSEEEFVRLFQAYAIQMGCDFRPDAVEFLLERQYRRGGRAMRRCHPRDLLRQVRNLCVFRGQPVEMRPEYFAKVGESYFTATASKA